MYISGEIRNAELFERIKNHPARGNMTQAEFYEYILERFVDLPESRLAILEPDFRSLQLQVDFLKKRVEDLEAQVQQLAASDVDGPEEPHSSPAVAELAVVAPGNGSEDLEGDFVVVLEKGDPFEAASKSFVDLTLRIVGGSNDGRSFTDRVMDFPWASRADFCKRAFGLQPADSLGKKLPEITGRKVLVRRTKKQGPDGTPRMMTYYHPLPSGSTK
jgi:hypothetical protein